MSVAGVHPLTSAYTQGMGLGTAMQRRKILPNKRNEALDFMGNFIQKMQDNRSSILWNMR